MAMTRDQITKEVYDILIDALGVDDDEVTNDATLMADLGAESIDFLDIVFRLEKSFAIKIPREELFPSDGLMNNPDLISDGKFTAAGLAELKSRMPHANLSDFESNPELNKLGDLFTVEAIINFVDIKLNAA